MNSWSIEEEARQAFELSQTYCGECRDYHLTRAFLKASGYQLGPQRDKAAFGLMLRRYTSPGARVLIAGAADTGVLAVTLDLIGDFAPRIMVADKCRTPLILCERFAATVGAEVDVVEGDIVTDRFGAFDLIIGHVVLGFIAPDQRVAFLRNIHRMLSPGGTFVLAMTNRGPGPRRPRASFDQVMSGLREKGVSLPGDGLLVSEALKRQLSPDLPRIEHALVREAEGMFPEADLQIVDVLEPAAATPPPPGRQPAPRIYFALQRR